MNLVPESDNSLSEVPQDPVVSGKWVVLALLAFGVSTTAFMWLFTYYSNKPFIPLRHALVKEFSRESSPNVQGGKDRGRGPVLLRIIMNVKFDPNQKSGTVPAEVNAMERRVAELAREHLDLTQYEKWVFILVHYNPESLPDRLERKREIQDIIAGRFE